MKNRKEDCFHLGVKALILTEDRKLLLLERHHPSKGIYWDIPGGRLQKGESQIDALRREVKEETGLDTISNANTFMMTLTDMRIPTPEGDVGLIFSVFLLNIADSFHPVLSDEHVKFEWCTPLEASQRLKHRYPNEFVEKMSYL